MERLYQCFVGLNVEQHFGEISEIIKFFDNYLMSPKTDTLTSELESKIKKYDSILDKIKTPSEKNLLSELGSEKSAVSFREGIKYVEDYIEQNPGQILGVTGMPCVGKSFFIKSFREHEEVEIIDEFWNPECLVPGNYSDKVEKAHATTSNGKVVIVLAPQLDRELVKETIHIVTNDFTRKGNNLNKIDAFDLTLFSGGFSHNANFNRMMYSEIWNRVEKVTYDIERYYANLIVSNTPSKRYDPMQLALIRLIAEKVYKRKVDKEDVDRVGMMMQ